jgi:hypothetical protein
MYILSTIISDLGEYWYVYDLVLLALIVIALIVLSFIKKRSDLDESIISVKGAIKNIQSAKKAKSSHIKLKLLYAKNFSASAAAELNRYIEKSGLTTLKFDADTYAEAALLLGHLSNSYTSLSKAEIDAQLDAILLLLQK